MVARELYTLKAGAEFAFTDGGPLMQIDSEPDFIDYEGHSLVLYRDHGSLHGHLCDHTQVWVLE
jgi:hypothetical protein